MKKLIIIALLLLLPTLLYAERLKVYTVSGSGGDDSYGSSASSPDDAVYVDDNGNVGIGTITPVTSLQVKGDSAAPTGTYYGIIRIDTNTGSNDVGYKLGSLAGAGSAGYSYIQAVHTDVANDANLILNPSGGNVGIGTVAPNGDLHIDSTGATIIRLSAGSGESAGLFLTDRTDSDNGYIVYYQGSEGRFTLRSLDSDGAGANANVMEIYDGTKDAIFTGNVGIGTTSPGAILSIQDTEPYIRLNDSAGGDVWDLRVDSGGAIAFYNVNDSKAALTIQEDKDVIINNGNVGIGTTNPGAKLDVVGSDNYIRAYKDADEFISLRTLGTMEIRRGGNSLTIDGQYGGVGSGGPTSFINNTDMRFTANEGSYLNQLYLSTTGKVGIGTTSPKGGLHIYDGASGQTPYSGARGITIEDNTDIGLSILTPSGNLGRILFGDESNASVGGFIYDHPNDALRFFANGGEQVRIDSNGNVGIGTTSPLADLHIDGGGGSNFILEDDDATTNRRIFRLSNYSDKVWFAGRNNDNSGSGDAGNFMVMDLANGNVGIGTTGPENKLDVSGGDILLDNNQWIKFEDTGGGNDAILGYDTSNSVYLSNPSTGSTNLLHLRVGGDIGLTVDNSGNVGIGTTSPGAKLEVIGILTADGLTLGANENITLGAQTLDHDGTDFVFNDSINTGANAIKSTVNMPGVPHHLIFNIANPNVRQAADNEICLWPVTPAALTITKIEVTLDAVTNEMNGDIKYADAFIGLANPVVINDTDTTSGVRSDSSITSGSVAAGKCIYFSFDGSPNAAITQASFDITFSWD